MSKKSNVLDHHGTKLSALQPGSVVYAARADLRRYVYKLEHKDADQRAPYAFHRLHVRAADTAADLIRLAIADRPRGVSSGKRNTRTIYSDEALLRGALELALAHGVPARPDDISPEGHRAAEGHS
jgi:hypothetical protein